MFGVPVLLMERRRRRDARQLMFGRRPDATLVRDLSATRRFMPILSPRRNDNLVWFELEVEVERALAWARGEERAAATRSARSRCST